MSIESRSWRIGVDVGGTFTDLVIVTADGQFHVVKVPSVPSNPAAGVLAAVDQAATLLRISTRTLLAECQAFIHGTTIATNCLLEGKGARVGMVVTEGFRDTLEIRRGRRNTPWDHRSAFSPPLVPRDLRLPVAGRLDRNGMEDQSLSIEQVQVARKALDARKVDAIAICLLNSFIDSSHEHAAAELLGDGRRAVYCSSDVIPLIGEYERWSTTVVNAYVGPRTIGYLRELEASLHSLGLRRPLLVLQNNGGAITVDEVAKRPAMLLLSGPAAGVGALAFYASRDGTNDMISMEIGGTSCDVMIMHDGTVAHSDHLDIGGYDVHLPSVDIHTIGAGGGTIAGVTSSGLVFAGPRGAGANPGPAGYGLGGTDPTLTDALLVLGRLRPTRLGDGTIQLDREKARLAVETCVAKPLGIRLEAAALGIVQVVEQKLLQAVQAVSSERGLDPVSFTLLAAGGAGPMHAASIARGLGCDRAYVPRHAGAFCALGMLNSDVRHDFIRVHLAPLDRPENLEQQFDELEMQAASALAAEGFPAAQRRFDRGVDLRYEGQHWDVTVPIRKGDDQQTIRAAFEKLHQQRFGHTLPTAGVRLTKLRLSGFGVMPPLPLQSTQLRSSVAPAPTDWTEAVLDDPGIFVQMAVYDGAALQPGHRIVGPALIEERTSTILLAQADVAHVTKHGDYVLTFEAKQ